MLKSKSTSLILLGTLSVIVGIIAMAWPGPTTLALVWVVAIWALVIGAVEIAAAFAAGESAGTRAMFAVTGLLSIAFGVVLSARPDIGAVTLALLFGLYSMIYGVTEIVLGVQMRQTGRTLQPVMHHAA